MCYIVPSTIAHSSPIAAPIGHAALANTWRGWSVDHPPLRSQILSANSQAPISIESFMEDIDVKGMIDRDFFLEVPRAQIEPRPPLSAHT